MNIRRRLEQLEAIFMESDDEQLLASLCNAMNGDELAERQVQRFCAVGKGNHGLLNVAELYLHGPAAIPKQ